MLTSTQKTLAYTSCVLGLVQGLTWTALALASIIVHERKYDAETEIYSYASYLRITLYEYYLVSTNHYLIDVWRVIKPTDFFILMWFYLPLSIGWVVISVYQCLAIYRNMKLQSASIVCWGVIVCSISIIDLTATSLLLRDYLNCASLTCHTAVGIVMTLTARGFTLWVINVILAVAEIVTGIQIIMKDNFTKSISDLFTIPKPLVVRQPLNPTTPDHRFNLMEFRDGQNNNNVSNKF